MNRFGRFEPVRGADEESGLLNRLRLYIETLRHVRPVQIYRRLLAPFVKRVARLTVPRPSDADLTVRGIAIEAPHHDPWNERDRLLRGHFCFLNETAELGWPPDWSGADQGLLWDFWLHYHHFLPLLEAREKRRLCRHWIESNPVGAEPGWHPYPLSRRITTWVRLGVKTREIRASLYRQTGYLSHTVEWHQPGNHLLENGRALALGGAFFLGTEAGDRWWKQGRDIVLGEIRDQVLSDGGHMERSPMYHALMLEALVDVLAADDCAGRNLLARDHRSSLEETAGQMVSFLAAVTHPDGGLALLNDATLEVAPVTSELLDYARRVTGQEPVPATEFEETGYFVHRDETAYLIVDGGPIGPDHLPAHSHADIFTYELSLGLKRFVVDAGVYEYEAGERRRYARSTGAHNTVTIDGTDQAECWDSFRVARRYPPDSIEFSQDGAQSTFSGRFAGYSDLLGHGLVHRRDLRADGRQKRIRIRDVVSGRGVHSVVSRIHLHPDVDIESQSAELVRVSRGGRVLTVRSNGHPIRRERGCYYPEFGREEEITVLALGARQELPVDIRYMLIY